MTGLAHTTDPQTSHDAAASLNPHRTAILKDAILILLWLSPSTGDELIATYASARYSNGWPSLPDPHSLKRRLSELHNLGVVKASGVTRRSVQGKQATVWELAVPLAQAREAVKP